MNNRRPPLKFYENRDVLAARGDRRLEVVAEGVRQNQYEDDSTDTDGTDRDPREEVEEDRDRVHPSTAVAAVVGWQTFTRKLAVETARAGGRDINDVDRPAMLRPEACQDDLARAGVCESASGGSPRHSPLVRSDRLIGAASSVGVPERGTFCVSGGPARYAEFADLGRGTALVEEPGHEFHGGVDVCEERLVSRTQVVEAGVPSWCVDEAVPGAAAVACEPDVALEAVLGKSIAFCTPEGLLFLGCDEFDHRCFGDVAQQVVRFDVVVACVEVAVVFHRQCQAAGLCKDAQSAPFAVPRAECDIEMLDEDLPDVCADPLVEYGCQEPPQRSGVDAAVRDMMPLLHVQRTLGGAPVVFFGCPAEVRER